MRAMPETQAVVTYDYAIIRVVPRVEREEFMNVGVIVSCQDDTTRDRGRSGGFLEAQIVLDAERLRALDAHIALDVLAKHLDAFRAICAGGAAAGALGKLSRRERFDWLTAPRSTIVQTSSVHSGHGHSGTAIVEHLMQTMVRRHSVERARGPA